MCVRHPQIVPEFPASPLLLRLFSSTKTETKGARDQTFQSKSVSRHHPSLCLSVFTVHKVSFRSPTPAPAPARSATTRGAPSGTIMSLLFVVLFASLGNVLLVLSNCGELFWPLRRTSTSDRVKMNSGVYFGSDSKLEFFL